MNLIHLLNKGFGEDFELMGPGVIDSLSKVHLSHFEPPQTLAPRGWVAIKRVCIVLIKCV